MTRLMPMQAGLLLLAGAAACALEWPTAPTPPGTTVTVEIDTRADGTGTGTGTGGDGGTGGSGGGDGVGGDTGSGDGPAITEDGQNDDGAVIYRIGPGQTFIRTGGDAATVWCRPASDCNGEGSNRTSVNAARPRASWVEDSSAFFRRSGSMGTAVTFAVDGHALAQNF